MCPAPVHPVFKSNAFLEKVDDLLPQTQCRKCGFEGCRPYASAIAGNETEINRCPPGGDATIMALAKLLKRDFKALDPQSGVFREKQVATINESQCIGCTLCIQACPVDAIVGAAKQMHTVIVKECTGCDLCLAPCPVDCIEMHPVGKSIDLQENNSRPVFFRFLNTDLSPQYHDKKTADIARQRYEFRLHRLAEEKHNNEKKQAGQKLLLNEKLTQKDKKAVIAAAVRRVKIKKAKYKFKAC